MNKREEQASEKERRAICLSITKAGGDSVTVTVNEKPTSCGHGDSERQHKHHGQRTTSQERRLDSMQNDTTQCFPKTNQ